MKSCAVFSGAEERGTGSHRAGDDNGLHGRHGDPGVTYFYEVEAVGVVGSSGPSNEASAEAVPGMFPTGWSRPTAACSSFGNANFKGSATGMRLGGPVVAMVATPDGKGYWLASANGGVFSFGDANFKGLRRRHAGRRPEHRRARRSHGGDARWKGYWLRFGQRRGVQLRDANFEGSAAGMRLGGPVVAMVATPDGKGYWLASANGGVFSFGDANFEARPLAFTWVGAWLQWRRRPTARVLARFGQRRGVQLR